MNEIKKEALDLKAVAINSLENANSAGRPIDDGPCPSYWCLKMKPDAFNFINKINPADLAVLIGHGFIKISELPKELQTAVQSANISWRPIDDDPCGNYGCARMKPGLTDIFDRINPTDLSALIKYGFVQESMLSNVKQAELKNIRLK